MCSFCICITLVIFCRTRISLQGLVLHLQCIGSHCCTCNANLCTGLKLRCIGERQTPSARRCTALHWHYTWLKRRSNERALSRDKVIPAHSGLVTKPRLDSQQRPSNFFSFNMIKASSMPFEDVKKQNNLCSGQSGK